MAESAALDSNEFSRVLVAGGKELKPAGHGVASVKDTFGTFPRRERADLAGVDPQKATGSIDRGADIDYHTVTGYDIVVTANGAAVVEVERPTLL